MKTSKPAERYGQVDGVTVEPSLLARALAALIGDGIREGFARVLNAVESYTQDEYEVLSEAGRAGLVFDTNKKRWVNPNKNAAKVDQGKAARAGLSDAMNGVELVASSDDYNGLLKAIDEARTSGVSPKKLKAIRDEAAKVLANQTPTDPAEHAKVALAARKLMLTVDRAGPAIAKDRLAARSTIKAAADAVAPAKGLSGRIPTALAGDESFARDVKSYEDMAAEVGKAVTISDLNEDADKLITTTKIMSFALSRAMSWTTGDEWKEVLAFNNDVMTTTAAVEKVRTAHRKATHESYTQDEYEVLSEAERGHLVRKVITNSKGRKQVVWVRPSDQHAPGTTHTRDQLLAIRTLIAQAVNDPNSLNPEQFKQLAQHLETVNRDDIRGLLKQVGEKVGGDKQALAERLAAKVKAGRDEARAPGAALARGDTPAGDVGAVQSPVSGVGTDTSGAKQTQSGDVGQIIRDVRGKMDITQLRAKSGGETGPNGEWYPGGAFIATQDMPKRLRDNLKKKATGRVQTRGGWVVPEPGQMSILQKLGGTVMNPRNGEINYGYLEWSKTTPEETAMYEEIVKKFMAGEDWVSVNDYPSLSRLEDVARLYAAGQAVPGAALDRLPEEYRAGLKKWEPKPSTTTPTVDPGFTGTAANGVRYINGVPQKGAEQPTATLTPSVDDQESRTKRFADAAARGARAAQLTPTPQQVNAVQSALTALQQTAKNADGRPTLVPVWDLRAAVQSSNPEITPEQFDSVILAMRRRDSTGTHRVTSVDDRSRHTPEQLLNGVHHVGENFTHLEVKEINPPTVVDTPTTGGNITPVPPQSAGVNQGGGVMDTTTTTTTTTHPANHADLLKRVRDTSGGSLFNPEDGKEVLRRYGLDPAVHAPGKYDLGPLAGKLASRSPQQWQRAISHERDPAIIAALERRRDEVMSDPATDAVNFAYEDAAGKAKKVTWADQKAWRATPNRTLHTQVIASYMSGGTRMNPKPRKKGDTIHGVGVITDHRRNDYDGEDEYLVRPFSKAEKAEQEKTADMKEIRDIEATLANPDSAFHPTTTDGYERMNNRLSELKKKHAAKGGTA